jgi:chromosome segregation ATPase
MAPTLENQLANCRAARRTAEQTIKSLATMLGWENVPPQDTLERDINALKARARTAEQRIADLEGEVQGLLNTCVPYVELEDAEKRITELEATLAALRTLLERLRGWDHLDGAADGPYWKHEIDTVLASALAPAGESK